MAARSHRERLIALAIVALVIALGSVTWWQARHPTEAPTAAVPSTPSASSTPEARAPEPASRDRDASPRDLSLDEKRGGHTLARHVGRTDDQLRERLRRETGISAASTYTNRQIAERTVARVLDAERTRIAAWVRRTGSRPNLALDHRGQSGQILGRTMRRNARSAVPSTDAVVVLRADGRDSFYVLTSYPEIGR